MSQLLIHLTRELNNKGHFAFLGSDGFQVNANDLKGGIYSVEVINNAGDSVLNCYSDLPRILNQVMDHV